MPLRELPAASLYRIRDPKNFKTAMRDDVQLLQAHKKYLSLSTIIMCCIDALAAGTGRATGGKFENYVNRHFPDLCRQLANACGARNGARTLYDNFRNGFAHQRSPKSQFAITEEHETPGVWAERVKVDGRETIALNIDRLAQEFLKLL